MMQPHSKVGMICNCLKGFLSFGKLNGHRTFGSVIENLRRFCSPTISQDIKRKFFSTLNWKNSVCTITWTQFETVFWEENNKLRSGKVRFKHTVVFNTQKGEFVFSTLKRAFYFVQKASKLFSKLTRPFHQIKCQNLVYPWKNFETFIKL